MQEYVILVDEQDKPVGTAEKMQAHYEGLLHRAFSVFVTDGDGRLLLQRRAMGKYHSRGLWTNTCCSHPRPGESLEEASVRRLQEEMGFACELKVLFPHLYRADLEDGLVEHEYDHVLLGHWQGSPAPDPEEVMDWQWVNAEQLLQQVMRSPAEYTFWFREILPRLVPLL